MRKMKKKIELESNSNLEDDNEKTDLNHAIDLSISKGDIL